MRRRLAMRVVAPCVAVPTTIALTDAARRPVVLEATTMADWQTTKLDGTGCHWSPLRALSSISSLPVTRR